MKLRKDAIDITGKKFGLLTVTSPVFPKRKHRGVEWNCECQCGNTCIAYGGHLRAGERVSCGCLAKKDIYVTAVKFIFDSYKRKSVRRNIDFNLSFDEFEKLINGDCYFCGREPFQEMKSPKHKLTRIKYVGIDRLDNKKGYETNNCVSCCKHCNFAKSDMSLEEFKNHIKRIYQWLLTDF